MKSYFDLIKSNLIDFNKVLLDNYSKLNINETECLVLYHVHQLLKKNSHLDLSELTSKMTLSDNEISEVILGLVNKGFISIQLNDGLEEYSLDDTYRILGYLFETSEQNELSNATAIEMKKTIASIEQKFKRIVSPMDITVIKKWFYDYKYDISIINEEIEKASKKKTASVNMVDRALFSRTRDNTIDEETLEALEQFKKKYGNN